MRRKEILLVIVLIGFGLMYELFDSGDNGFFQGCSFNSRGLLEKTFIPFTVDETRFDGVERLEIVNKAGSIVLKPSTGSETVVRPEIRVYHRSKSRAQRIKEDIQVNVKEEGGKLRISTGVDGEFPFQRVRIHLEVQIPVETFLNVRNRYGDVSIHGVGREVDVVSKYGDFTASNLPGIKMRHGYGDIVLKDIAGLVDLQTRYGKLSISNTHSAELKCHHTRVIVDGIEEGLSLENSHNSIQCADIKGDLSIDARHCKIVLDRIESGRVVVANSYKNVTLSEVSAENVNVLMSHGNAVLDFSKITDSVSIKSKYTNIVLALPASVEPLFHIKTTYGNIKNDTGIDMDIFKGKIKTTVTSEGGKPSVVIDNTYGDVHLKSASHTDSREKIPAEAPEIKI
jgi:hypothetical protein